MNGGKYMEGYNPVLILTLHSADLFSKYCGMNLWGVGFVD